MPPSLLGQAVDHHPIVLPLKLGWTFQEVGGSRWYPAVVPGCVHTDLLENHLIDEPFNGANEQKLQWIDKTFWIYQTTFSVPRQLLARGIVDLVFEGLDTYATVFLNDVLLLRVDNMFRRWRVNCKQFLHEDGNVLRVQFSSPINKILPALRRDKYPLPAVTDRGEKTSPYTRKAPYQYGWDWAPRLVTCGIWKPVYLEAWDIVRIRDFHVQQTRLEPHLAQLQAEVELEATVDAEAELIVECQPGKMPQARKRIGIARGKNYAVLPMSILEPELWWPNGLGLQPLYEFQVKVEVHGRQMERSRVRTGLRTVELRRQTDPWGKSFELIVNGLPVFAKGANWVPPDSFPSRIPMDRYRRLLSSCRDTNMNLIRIWGGGIYECDEFYDLCDEMGLLIWQDFMFSCTLYPGDQAFLENVKQEAEDVLTRLRNHPCLALWCGNNEVETGWFDWGWKKKYPAQFWDNYQRLFYGILPASCTRLDPSRPYWPSSPSSNLEDAPNSGRVGDVHFWGVWHGDLPIEAFGQQIPRFLSEFGFQSFPPLETLRSFASPDELSIDSPSLIAHQKDLKGNQRILDYVLRYYPRPKDFESLVYLSQVLQAEAIKGGVEHLRGIMPRCMGTLFWQLNDCWPTVSWSSVDYWGRWKALQYYARRFYSNMLVSFREAQGQIEIVVAYDGKEVVSGTLSLRLLDFSGGSLWERHHELHLDSLQSQVIWSLNRRELLAGNDVRRVFLQAELRRADGRLVENRHFFENWKNLLLPQPNIQTRIVTEQDGPTIQLASDRFASNVYLSMEGLEGTFSDNYFDLLPGRPMEIRFVPSQRASRSEILRKLKVRSMVDAFSR